MAPTPRNLPQIIAAIAATLKQHEDEVTDLDGAIGDGDHVVNLQRGVAALQAQSAELADLDWKAAFQKIGMTVMSKVGGASGSLYGTLFVTLAKTLADGAPDRRAFAAAFAAGVEAMQARGKSSEGEKTMLDVLIPVARCLEREAERPLPALLDLLVEVAWAGAEATRDMVATKGRASFLGERAKGVMDAGARTSQLMITAIAAVVGGEAA
ncbi:MAG: dihydroxyacetone kinase subunit L [Methylococcaceae bacterium]|nr:dihydroxyacetone kinase subunit L [Methylococcaceae bacterium]